MPSGVVGSLLVRLQAMTAEFDAGMRKSADIAKTVGKQIGTALEEINSKVGGLLPTISLAAGVGVVKHALNEFVELAKEMDHVTEAAEKIGVSSSQFFMLDKLAKKSATSVETLGVAMFRMSRQIESGKLNIPGLSNDDLKGKSRFDQFLAVRDALHKIGAQGKESTVLFDTFGKSGAELAGVIRKSADEMERFKNSVPDENSVQKLARFGEAWERLEGVGKRFKIRAAGMAAGAIESYGGAGWGVKAGQEALEGNKGLAVVYGIMSYLSNQMNAIKNEEKSTPENPADNSHVQKFTAAAEYGSKEAYSMIVGYGTVQDRQLGVQEQQLDRLNDLVALSRGNRPQVAGAPA